MNMSDVLEKEAAELLKSLERPSPDPKPKSENQVYFLHGSNTAPAGGKAAGGRPRPPGSRFARPTAEDLKEYEATAAERTAFIDNDPIVKGSKGKDSMALLATLKAEVAREAAALAYQRIENEKMGKDISQVSGRRIDAIKKIADIELEMRKIGFDQVDVTSETFQRIFKLWIESIKTVAEETLSPEQLDLFFNRLTTEMDGWEAKAADLIR
jgi:hypothetical protein